MTFLPIVERELRLATRKRSTFWLRVATVLVGLVIAGGSFLLHAIFGGSSAGFGAALFGTLTWLALAAALSAGLFLTSDCLSAEKREGTLGFLFLTDLRGYDVVAGKLFVTSLRGFYALLALFPMLAVTLLMGGPSGGAFAKTTLALLNALFYSLAAGLLVSALSRDAVRAMTGTLFVLLLVVAGGPLANGIIAAATGHRETPLLNLSSPIQLFREAGAWGQTWFWPGLALNQGLAWLMLGLACFLIPRGWQEKRGRSGTVARRWSHAWRYGGARHRSGLRRKLLGRNPVLWLACRERWQSLGIWAMAILVGGAFVLLLRAGLPQEVWMIWSSVAGLFTLVLYLWTASQAGRFFVEARRSGLMELLLATPLNEKEIVRGQWRALLRTFAVPVLLLLGVQAAGNALSQEASWKMVAAQTTVFTPKFAITLATAVVTAVTTCANLVALSWFGMWMGMTSKNVNFATLKTLVFVQVIPAMVFAVASGLVAAGVMLWMTRMTMGATASSSGARGATGFMGWFPLMTVGISTVLSLGKDGGFIFWSRGKLYSSVRLQAGQSLTAALAVIPVACQAPIPTPPVIAVPR